jgi:hypothetical protein
MYASRPGHDRSEQGFVVGVPGEHQTGGWRVHRVPDVPAEAHPVVVGQSHVDHGHI